MNDWDRINRTSGPLEQPEPPAYRFLGALPTFLNKEPGQIRVLDIGPGRSGRHSRNVEERGYNLTAVDVSHECRAHYHCDIHDFNPPAPFDCILDIKTLCQDPDPPYQKLCDWLNPGGVLFAMLPSLSHRDNPVAFDIRRHPDYEYEFMRMATEKELEELFSSFSGVVVYQYIQPIRIGTEAKYLFNWCVEASK